MEAAEYGWNFVCIGANIDGFIRDKHEFHMGEGYGKIKSPNFWKVANSEGKIPFLCGFYSLAVS